MSDPLMIKEAISTVDICTRFAILANETLTLLCIKGNRGRIDAEGNPSINAYTDEGLANAIPIISADTLKQLDKSLTTVLGYAKSIGMTELFDKVRTDQ